MRNCRRNEVRQKAHFASRLKRITVSSPLTKNISISFFPKLMSLDAVPPRYEGRFAIVTDVEAGCGGRVDVAAWFILAPTNSIDAHGQVAWSRYPDAGIKLATMLAHYADDGGQKARRTGENAKQLLKPLRGECRLSRLNLW
jgi:hypothetical protein